MLLLNPIDMNARWFAIKPLVGVELGWKSHSQVDGERQQSAECCDGCGRFVPTLEIHFDGHSFFCRKCEQAQTQAALKSAQG